MIEYDNNEGGDTAESGARAIRTIHEGNRIITRKLESNVLDSTKSADIYF